MRFLLASRLVLVGGLALGACAATGLYSAGPFRGRVVDAETKKPLEGAAVLAVWYKRVYGGPGGPKSQFYEAHEVLTDANGEFTIPALDWVGTMFVEGPELRIFKPGYGFFPRQHVSPRGDLREILRGHFVVELPRLRTREERLESLAVVPDRVPLEKMPHLRRLQEEERANLHLGRSERR